MQTIRLQGIGHVEAIAYGDVQAGDHIVFNYGATYRVLAAHPFGLSVKVIAEDKNGKVWTFTRRATTLIGVTR